MGQKRKPTDEQIVAVAKQFCLPDERFGAGCLAWASARNLASSQDRPDAGAGALVATLAHFINQEIDRMDRAGTTSAIVKLGRLAVAIQRQPRFNDGANDEVFLFRVAVEAAIEAHRTGQTARDAMIAYVGGNIDAEGERRQKGSKGFYSAKDNRAAGQSIDAAVDAFAACFVDDIWNGVFRGHPPSSTSLRMQMAAYRYVFTRGHATVTTAAAA